MELKIATKQDVLESDALLLLKLIEQCGMDPSMANIFRQANSIVTTLVGGIEDTNSRLKLAKVEHNFCAAALGLFALCLVRRALLLFHGTLTNTTDSGRRSMSPVETVQPSSG